MPHRTGSGRQGFSLVELAVGATIAAGIVLTVLRFMTAHLELWETSSTQSQLRSQLQHTMNQVTRELQQATRAATTIPPDLNVPAAPGNTQVTFFLPTAQVIDAVGDTQWNLNNPVQYQFVPAVNQLQRVDAVGTRVLGTEVVSVTFDDQDTDATLLTDEVRMTLVLQRTTAYNRLVTMSDSTTVKLRN